MPIYYDENPITRITAEGREISRIYLGDRQVWTSGPIQHPAEQKMWASRGTYNYLIPPWAGYIDIVRLGAGGGGAAGDGAIARAGQGGNAGTWALARIDVRTLTSRHLLVEVGAGGAEGRASSTAPGSNGGASKVSVDGVTIGSSASGGAGGVGAAGTANGGSSGNRQLHGRNYTGGNGGTGGSGVGKPGGRGSGGGGGNGGIFGQFREGGRGGDGVVWITAMTRYEVEN